MSKKNLAGTIVEGGRTRGSKWSRRYRNRIIRRFKVRLGDDYEAVNHPVTRRVSPYHYREFADNLNPLWRWLERQVGRPWGDVYSDLCRTYDRRKTRNWHMLDHVRSEIESDNNYYWREYGIIGEGFYIDGENILRYKTKAEFNAEIEPIWAARRAERILKEENKTSSRWKFSLDPGIRKQYGVEVHPHHIRGASKGVFFSDLPADSVLNDLTEPEE